MEQIENRRKEIKSIDDLVLVHLTDYLPKGGIIRTPKSAGAVQVEKYNGIEYQKRRERDTIHFAINGEVENNTGGSWNEIKYAIIIPLKNMKKEKIFGGSTVDLYTIGDVEIPEGSYILCLEDEQKTLQQEVGENIQVKGIDDDNVKGYANKFIEELGYKVEDIGFWSWGNEQDNKIANDILLENGWNLGAHSYSEHRRDEVVFEDINRTIEIIKIMKNEALSNPKLGCILGNHQPMGTTAGLFDNSQYLDTFYKKMEEIGISIPDSIIKEVESIKEGKISDELMEQKRQEYIRSKIKETDYPENKELAQAILRKRVVGEIRLSQIKESIKENGEIKFEDLLESFDDTLYEYTTEDRRTEFLKSQGIELSDVEMKILGNQELKNIYLEISDIKDIPYKDLSEKDRQKFHEFQRFYNRSFEEQNLSDDMNFDNNGNFINANGAIFKKNGKPFSQEEIGMLEGKYKANNSNILVVLNNITWDNNTSLTQYVQNCDQMVSEVNEILNQRTVSTEALGRETFEKQKDIRAKINMEQILAQKMKEYTISKSKGVEK